MLSSPQCDLCGRTEKYMAEFDPDYTAKFYGAYGHIERERLEATPYGRLQASIHADVIERYVRRVTGFLTPSVCADISGLSMFSDDNFDAVICYYRRG